MPEPREGRPGRLGVGNETADGHETADLERVEPGRPLDRIVQLGRREAGLRRVVVDVDLEQDRVARGRAGASDIAGEAVQPLGQPDGVDGLDEVESLERAAGLVRLERTDQVPRRAGDLRDLGLALLDAVLTERADPGPDGVEQAARVDLFRDRDKRDIRGVATDPRAGDGDPREDSGVRSTEGVDVRGRARHRLAAGVAPAGITCGGGSSGSPGRRRRTSRAVGRRSRRPSARSGAS